VAPTAAPAILSAHGTASVSRAATARSVDSDLFRRLELPQLRKTNADHRVRAGTAGDRADPRAHRRTHQATRSAANTAAAPRGVEFDQTLRLTDDWQVMDQTAGQGDGWE
jgi:hypothetical protein